MVGVPGRGWVVVLVVLFGGGWILVTIPATFLHRLEPVPLQPAVSAAGRGHDDRDQLCGRYPPGPAGDGWYVR